MCFCSKTAVTPCSDYHRSLIIGTRLLHVLSFSASVSEQQVRTRQPESGATLSGPHSPGNPSFAFTKTPSSSSFTSIILIPSQQHPLPWSNNLTAHQQEYRSDIKSIAESPHHPLSRALHQPSLNYFGHKRCQRDLIVAPHFRHYSQSLLVEVKGREHHFVGLRSSSLRAGVC
ncbi:uncharacterized protein UHOD_20543 [Ustilago sp. UG-2017b]|nr:uncharacterized protein UHOD_20543 [Ustilago sp. UG-2017b]